MTEFYLKYHIYIHLMLCYVMLCYVMLCYVMLCYVMLCYVMLCYVMLCYVMLCYVNEYIYITNDQTQQLQILKNTYYLLYIEIQGAQ